MQRNQGVIPQQTTATYSAYIWYNSDCSELPVHLGSLKWVIKHIQRCREYSWFYLLINLYLSRKHKKTYDKHIQRTGKWGHNGTEHCPKYIKIDKQTTLDMMKSGQLQLENEMKTDSKFGMYNSNNKKPS